MMGKRIHNFNAGPAALPLPVLEEIREEFVDYKGSGMSITEVSHRSKWFDDVINEACEKLSFHPRTSNEVETYEHLGGMQSFGDTFQSRINAWIEDLRNKTAPAKVDAKAADALAAQTVIEAAIKSWDTKSVVTI